MLSRRAFVVGSLSSGCLLAHSALAATAPHHVVPEGNGPFPLVVVVHDVAGIAGHIEVVCSRLARGGHFAVAPVLFIRQAPSEIPDARVVTDLDATIAWAKSTGKVAGDRVGLMGFGWGGRIVWIYSAFGQSRAKAGIAWDGPLSHAQNAFQTKSPLDIAQQLKMPVLGMYSDAASSVPPAHVSMMRRALGAQTTLERAQQAARDGKPELVKQLLREHREREEHRERPLTLIEAGKSAVLEHSPFEFGGSFGYALSFLNKNGV